MVKNRYDSARQWYAIHTYSGYEEKVADSIKQRAQTIDMADKIFDAMVPKEKQIQIKNGKRKIIDAKIFQGYVLVEMKLTDETWYIVRNTPGVTGFVGIDGKPTPLRRSEFNKIMRRTNPRGAQEPKRTTMTTDLEVGQAVKVVSGPLADFDGLVSEVMPEAGKVKVMLTIFGRETPVELTLDQIATIS